MVCPTTVGREQQLASIGYLLDQLVAGRGRTVLVTGEAGIGKSRLVAEARAMSATRGVRVFQGSAFEVDQALPYGPVVDLFRTFLAAKPPEQALDVLGPAAAALARLLPVVAAWLGSSDRDRTAAAAEPAHEKQRLLQGLLLAFDRLLDFYPGPTIVAVEDVHWADEASLELLLHLARSAAARPLLLLLTIRTEDAGPSVTEFRTTLERQRLMIELAAALRCARDPRPAHRRQSLLRGGSRAHGPRWG